MSAPSLTNYPRSSVSNLQDSMLAEYDSYLEPVAYKPNRVPAIHMESEYTDLLNFFCTRTMNSVSVQDIKKRIQSLETLLAHHPVPRLQSRIFELEQRLHDLPVKQHTVSPLVRKSEPAQTNICDICMEAPKRVAFRCGHIMCEDCSPKLTVCPTCRVPVTDRIKLYM